MRMMRMKMVMRVERTSHWCTRSALPSVPAIRQIPPGNRGYGYNYDDGYYDYADSDDDDDDDGGGQS